MTAEPTLTLAPTQARATIAQADVRANLQADGRLDEPAALVAQAIIMLYLRSLPNVVEFCTPGHGAGRILAVRSAGRGIVFWDLAATVEQMRRDHHLQIIL